MNTSLSMITVIDWMFDISIGCCFLFFCLEFIFYVAAKSMQRIKRYRDAYRDGTPVGDVR